MVEGHSVHRVADRNTRQLVGKKFKCTSPNGRFTDGAAAIDGKPFRAIEAVGKNLFAFFGAGDADDVVVHVHFGMAGVWAIFEAGEAEPATTPTTRLRMVDEATGLASHLSAMTVNHGDRASRSGRRPNLAVPSTRRVYRSPRNSHVAAAASTGLHGIATSEPRRRPVSTE